MSARPKPTTFIREVGLGLVLSLVGAATFAALAYLMPLGDALRFVVAVLAASYGVLTIARSGEATGRVVGVCGWLVLAVVAWIAPLPLPAYVALHAGGIWLTRALFAHARVVTALLDLGLTFLAIAFAAWAALRTEGVFLAFWCFFLVQALHVTLPSRAWRLGAVGRARREREVTGRFEQAFAAADEALQRLAARR